MYLSLKPPNDVDGAASVLKWKVLHASAVNLRTGKGELNVETAGDAGGGEEYCLFWRVEAHSIPQNGPPKSRGTSGNQSNVSG